MTIALLCSGQGRQHAGMFGLTGGRAETAPLFATAGRLLGGEACRLAGEGHAAFANRAAQILCVTQAMAAWTLLAPVAATVRLVAGYSVGELAAWGIAGLVPPNEAIALAAVRAELMDAASGPDDGLAFVRGLPRRQVARLAAAHDAAIAIVNPGDSFIIGGGRPRLTALVEAARAAGAAHAGLLAVDVASHTGRLAAAVGPFHRALGARILRPPAAGLALLTALDGSTLFDAAAARAALAAELASPLDWQACLEAAFERGADTFLELGPGRALADMVEAMRPAAEARSVDDFHTPAGLLAWLGRRGNPPWST